MVTWGMLIRTISNTGFTSIIFHPTGKTTVSETIALGRWWLPRNQGLRPRQLITWVGYPSAESDQTTGYHRPWCPLPERTLLLKGLEFDLGDLLRPWYYQIHRCNSCRLWQRFYLLQDIVCVELEEEKFIYEKKHADRLTDMSGSAGKIPFSAAKEEYATGTLRWSSNVIHECQWSVKIIRWRRGYQSDDGALYRKRANERKLRSHRKTYRLRSSGSFGKVLPVTPWSCRCFSPKDSKGWRDDRRPGLYICDCGSCKTLFMWLPKHTTVLEASTCNQLSPTTQSEEFNQMKE